jgi:hypothetical protein
VWIVVSLVVVAGLSAAGVWWWMSRSRAPVEGSSGFGPSAGTFEAEDRGDFFVLPPSGEPPVRFDRPPRAISLARLALTVGATTVLLVALAYLIGFVVKVQLDRYFTGGG